MGEKGKTWMAGWLDAQQGYWKAWADLAQRGTQAPETPGNAWAEGLSRWWQAVSPLAPPGGREVFDRMMELSRGYFSLAERFASGDARGDKGTEALSGWFEQMQKGWADWMQGGMRPDAQPKDAMAFWDLPMDTWNRLAASLMPMPGDFTQAFHPEGSPANLRDQVNRFLSLPAVGYTREFQEQYQRLGQLAMDYGAALQAYHMAFGKLAMDTAGKFQQALQAQAREAKPYTSLREVYDHWVEVSEAAYARFVMTDDYQALYGRLVNALMAMKHHLARMVDQGLEAMHMPTHAEISTLQRRQQELRRENIRMRNEIKAIHGQMEALRRSNLEPPEGDAGAAPAGKPSARAGAAAKTAMAKTTAARRASARAPAAAKTTQKKTGGARK